MSSVITLPSLVLESCLLCACVSVLSVVCYVLCGVCCVLCIVYCALRLVCFVMCVVRCVCVCVLKIVRCALCVACCVSCVTSAVDKYWQAQFLLRSPCGMTNPWNAPPLLSEEAFWSLRAVSGIAVTT